MADMKKISEATISWGKKHMTFLKGLGALLFGISLVSLSHRLILNLIVFTAGLLLIYYGLVILKLKKITDFIDKLLSNLKKSL